ncbi:hypothetical protein CAPTEDRAFT_199928 [Capitella teleta]|uniref:Uncharacterized protein n=1 Tax=Capitella teleta TaxID=283909 RepID=R7UDH0_CAPTE|nr:hypothetical protein CAPTEDRAFT_199928 [Capitella teleta]|eukprot:ELU04024.1 hypothetical protein CAPTEDRAFT_199928 [Capitella teleta]
MAVPLPPIFAPLNLELDPEGEERHGVTVGLRKVKIRNVLRYSELIVFLYAFIALACLVINFVDSEEAEEAEEEARGCIGAHHFDTPPPLLLNFPDYKGYNTWICKGNLDDWISLHVNHVHHQEQLCCKFAKGGRLELFIIFPQYSRILLRVI